MQTHIYSLAFMCAAISIFSCSDLLSQESGAQNKQDESKERREKIDSAINLAIELLEAEKHQALLQQFMPPKTLDMAVKDLGSMDELVSTFKRKKAKELLGTLQLIKDQRPVFENNGKTAIFSFDSEASSHKKLTFQKIDKYWRIKN